MHITFQLYPHHWLLIRISTCASLKLIIYIEKFLNSDWLREVQCQDITEQKIVTVTVVALNSLYLLSALNYHSFFRNSMVFKKLARLFFPNFTPSRAITYNNVNPARTACVNSSFSYFLLPHPLASKMLFSTNSFECLMLNCFLVVGLPLTSQIAWC